MKFNKGTEQFLRIATCPLRIETRIKRYKYFENVSIVYFRCQQSGGDLLPPLPYPLLAILMSYVMFLFRKNASWHVFIMYVFVHPENLRKVYDSTHKDQTKNLIHPSPIFIGYSVAEIYNVKIYLLYLFSSGSCPPAPCSHGLKNNL